MKQNDPGYADECPACGGYCGQCGPQPHSQRTNGYPPRPEGCAGVFLAALIGAFVIILTILLLWPWDRF